MRVPLRRSEAISYALALGTAAGVALHAPAAHAVTYRYASSSNRIYVESGGTTTLTEIRANTPSLPAEALTRSGNVWLLAAELRIEDGSVLLLHGSAVGGDVDELRLRSDGGGFVNIWAEYGTIDIEATRIHSWSPGAGAVDTSHSDGRAFMRVRSFLDSSGVARESRMDIVNSEISYLGYNAAESYGLVWKVIGTPGSNFELFDRVNVYGDIAGSNIHHNYFGVYAYGHSGGQWIGNEVHHNVKYGFDPHDDSDHLLIQDNVVHDNGNHGIIASKRCNNVVVRGNRSYGNTGNGIMIHRSSNDALVEGNHSYLNTDSGVALFASKRSTVRNNLLLDNGNAGVRLSMGQADSVIESNEIGFSGKYGFYFYRGSDTPEPGDDARPKNNLLRYNDVHDIAGDAIKLTDADRNLFLENRFERIGNTLRFTTGVDNVVRGNVLPTTATFSITGSAAVATHIVFREQPLIRLLLQNDFSTAGMVDNVNAIFDADEPLYNVATPTGSRLGMTRQEVGASTTVYRRPLHAFPATGDIWVRPTLWNLSGDRSKAWQVVAPAGPVSIYYIVGDLAPRAAYTVDRDGVVLGTFTANVIGEIEFTHVEGSSATYSVRPR